VTIQLDRIATLGVSAASGAVIRDGRLYVVADDELGLHVYSLDGALVSTVALFEGSLPTEPKARKKAKRDLEALALLPDASLLALGSGSKPRRVRAAHVVGDAVRTADLTDLYAAIGRTIDEINVEGAAVVGDQLVLAQRGNGKKRENALVFLDLSRVLSDLTNGEIRASAIARIERIDLGSLDGVHLSITDLAVDPHGTLVFTAAAEDTDDPYLDGACTGSVVGAIGASGAVAWSVPVSPVVKLEGLAHVDGDSFLFVADADDPTIKAPLFRASVGPRYEKF